MSQVTLAVASQNDTAYIQVSGRATFSCSEDLKNFCTQMLDEKVSKIVLEMKKCSGMDSTFMGILTMISLRARKQNVTVELTNINEANKNNLFSHGLKKMFTYCDNNNFEQTWNMLNSDNISQDQHQENVLNAHQTLIDVHEDNRKEFQDIVTFLKGNPS